MMKRIDKPRNLRKHVYEEIKSAIVSNLLYPGMKLDEKDLSEQLGVSRTPIREAFARLDQEGLVTIKPNKGVFVSRITAKDLIEVLYLREVLEGLAVRLFTEMAEEKDVKKLKEILAPYTEENLENNIEDYNLANVDFHNYIIHKTNNKRLINTLKRLYNHISMAKLVKVIPLTHRGKKSYYEHQKLLEAIESGDALQAENMMKAHITSLREDILDNLELIESRNQYLNYSLGE